MNRRVFVQNVAASVAGVWLAPLIGVSSGVPTLRPEHIKTYGPLLSPEIITPIFRATAFLAYRPAGGGPHRLSMYVTVSTHQDHADDLVPVFQRKAEDDYQMGWLNVMGKWVRADDLRWWVQ